jgi:hypothetical protein
MANRWTNQFSKTFEKEVNSIFCQISFGASGAPTLATSNVTSASLKGVASVSRTSTGLFVLTLQDAWVKLLYFSGSWDTSGASGAAPVGPIIYVTTNSITASPGVITFKTGDYVNGAVADPASGEILRLKIVVGNSTAY